MKPWIVILFLIPSLTFAQSYKDGVVVIQFTADFVSGSEVNLDKLEGADQLRLFLTDHPKIFEKEKIKFLPTVVLFHNRKTVLFIESDITLKLPDNTLDTIQFHINKIIKSKF